eukprot:CAMPEP_0173359732 /NCGR_PEP_ID=MMETSP1144-20121109/20204_1 /TAXON_ID=483371 /ORGANISM="non described non described, Strain CCMP2298" /LENGTH=432 /DNA_ID=CAMNT_0014309025 /DNA_START=95 /DNA_END=1389 /DNA_ORIENTATION=-
MNRADQQQLFQTANKQVLDIRQLEIDFFNNLLTAIGTKAALIGGFTYGILTQNIIDYSNKYINYYKFLYYVLAAVTISSALHVVLCCMFVQVFGPGLALNGPLGSMTRASEGMSFELTQIILVFSLMACSFVVSTAWLFWCVMTFYQALASNIAFFIAARYWYFYCERIYLRFYWSRSTDEAWNLQRESGISVDANPADNRQQTDNIQTYIQPPRSLYKFIASSFRAPLPRPSTRHSRDSDSRSSMQSGPPRELGAAEQAAAFALRIDVLPLAQTGTSTRGVAMEGYFTTLVSNRWERRYFVLTSGGDIVIYRTRQGYRHAPKEPAYTRPLHLLDFLVVVRNRDLQMRLDAASEESQSNTSAGTATSGKVELVPNRFQLDLVPREMEDSGGGNSGSSGSSGSSGKKRDTWKLRCDTEEELEVWVYAIGEICP